MLSETFAKVTRRDSSNILAQVYLGQSLFRQEHYAEAAIPFQKARELEKSGKEPSTVQDRILTDQLAMSYGVAGDLKKTHALLNEAIGKDPGYPLNYRNRACAYAEESDKAKALANPQLAFDRRGRHPEGFPEIRFR